MSDSRLDDLERRIARLEDELWPLRKFGITADSERCQVCSGLYKDMTHYVCPNMNCPGKITFGAKT